MQFWLERSMTDIPANKETVLNSPKSFQSVEPASNHTDSWCSLCGFATYCIVKHGQKKCKNKNSLHIFFYSLDYQNEWTLRTFPFRLTHKVYVCIMKASFVQKYIFEHVISAPEEYFIIKGKRGESKWKVPARKASEESKSWEKISVLSVRWESEIDTMCSLFWFYTHDVGFFFFQRMILGSRELMKPCNRLSSSLLLFATPVSG